MAQTGVAGPALGEKVKELRKKQGTGGWSQEKLARVMEVSRETIRKIEEGRAMPRSDTLERLARALGTSPNYLLGFSGDTPNPGSLKRQSRSLATAAA